MVLTVSTCAVDDAESPFALVEEANFTEADDSGPNDVVLEKDVEVEERIANESDCDTVAETVTIAFERMFTVMLPESAIVPPTVNVYDPALGLVIC